MGRIGTITLLVSTALDFPLAIPVVVFVIAFLYSGVGLGGASGYLAVMNLFDVPAQLASSTALILNLFVAGIAFINYFRLKHFESRLFWPFVVTSIPFAFIGGIFRIDQVAYQIVLNLFFVYMGIKLLFSSQNSEDYESAKPLSKNLALLIGAAIGLISGLIGIGGGVILSPIIILRGWGNAKKAAAICAGFVWLNSLSGLIGRAWVGTLHFDPLGFVLIPIGILASLAGSQLGAKYLSIRAVCQTLGVLLLLGTLRFVVSLLSGI